MPSHQVKEVVRLIEAGKMLLKTAGTALGLSARAYEPHSKSSSTIAIYRVPVTSSLSI